MTSILEPCELAQSRLNQSSSLDIVQKLCGSQPRIWKPDLSANSYSDIFNLLEFT